MYKKDNIPDNFGDYVRQLREKHGYSLQDVCDRVDISISYLSDIEHGRKTAPPSTLQMELATTLCTNVRETTSFYDLAGKSRNDIPLDVRAFLTNNNKHIRIIRKEFIYKDN